MQALLALLLASGILISPAHLEQLKTVTFYNTERTFNNHGTEISTPELTDRKTGEIFIYKKAQIRNVVHGIGHVICEKHGHPAPFGQPEFITDYAKTDKLEDCAETFEAYYMNECFINKFWKLRRPTLYKKCLLIRQWDRTAK